MVLLAQALAAAEVGLPTLVLTRYHVYTAGQQQRQQEVGAEAAVAQEHVAGLEAVQQLAQQGRLASLLALVRPTGHSTQRGGSQGHEHDHPQDGKSHARLLRSRLRPGGLVRGGVGGRAASCRRRSSRAAPATASPPAPVTPTHRRRRTPAAAARLPATSPAPDNRPRYPARGARGPGPRTARVTRATAATQERATPACRACDSHAHNVTAGV